MIEKLYTVEEVAELASVTGRTIRNYLKSGRLVGRKIGGQWRFPENEVQRLLTGAPPELQDEPEPDAQPAEPMSGYAAKAEPADYAAPNARDSYVDSYDEPHVIAMESDLPDEEPEPAYVEAPSRPAQAATGSTVLYPTGERAPTPAPLPETSAPPPPQRYAQPAPVPAQAQPPARNPATQAPAPPVQAPAAAQPVYTAPVSEPSVPENTGGYATFEQPPAPQQPLAAQPTPATQNAFYVPTAPQPAQAVEPVAVPPAQPQAPVLPYSTQAAAQPLQMMIGPGGEMLYFTVVPGQAPGQPSVLMPVTLPGLSPAPPMGTAGYTAPPPAGAYPVQTPVMATPAQPVAQPVTPVAAQPAVQLATPQEAPVADIPEAAAKTESEAIAEKAPEEARPRPLEPSAPPPELSDVGKRVSRFISEVHDCSAGPQTCSVIDLYQSISAARTTSERLSQIAEEESQGGLLCQSFVEYDERFFMARYTLFGTSAFLMRCLKLIG